MDDNSFSNAQTAFAVVSPCSQCKNQAIDMGIDGRPACPRRKWQDDQKKIIDSTGNPDPQIAPLATFGTEGTSQDDGQSLRNPVYLDDGKTTLIWIATLRDNTGVRDKDNNVVAPSILDPAFVPDSTEYIYCQKYPFIPAQHEASYRQSGGLKEMDTVIATTVTHQQFNTNPVTIDDQVPDQSTDINVYQPVLIGGVINKVNLVYNTPRTPVEVDYTIEGT